MVKFIKFLLRSNNDECFRPAFLEEFTTLEQEMEQLFVQYSTKLRCLNYLEHLVAEAERAEMQRQQLTATHRNVEAIPLDRGEPSEMLSLDDSPPDQKQVAFSRPERPRASTGGKALAKLQPFFKVILLLRSSKDRKTIKTS